MAMLWKKIKSLAKTLKKGCIEELWLFGLLAPLVILLTLVGARVFKDSKNEEYSETQIVEEIMASAEISSAEVALIVAKPIGELLNIEVYFPKQSTRRRGELLATLRAEDVFKNGASNWVFVSAQKPTQALGLQDLKQLKSKKNQKIAEQS